MTAMEQRLLREKSTELSLCCQHGIRLVFAKAVRPQQNQNTSVIGRWQIVMVGVWAVHHDDHNNNDGMVTQTTLLVTSARPKKKIT